MRPSARPSSSSPPRTPARSPAARAPAPAPTCCAACCSAASAPAACKAAGTTTRPTTGAPTPASTRAPTSSANPRVVYLREAGILPELDTWLATSFDPARLPATIEALAASQDHAVPRELVSLREQIGTCDQKLAQYRAALDSGADPAVGRWITETQARKLAAEARLRAATGTRPGDLNTETREISPDRENHAVSRVVRRKTNRRHMTGDHHDRTAVLTACPCPGPHRLSDTPSLPKVSPGTVWSAHVSGLARLPPK